MTVCKDCGQRNLGAVFCKKCGNDLYARERLYEPVGRERAGQISGRRIFR